jgi:quercetin dioxygenase-like cupin family protein
MIRKNNKAKKREFKGIIFDVLAIGEKSMITRMNYKKGDHVPFHNHPNEQSGYAI